MKGVWVCLAVLSVLWASVADSQTGNGRTIVWRDRPVALSMVPNAEKILSFDEDVQWSIPRSLLGVIDGEAVAGNVFLTAIGEFESTRFHFRGIDSGRYYLLDLASSPRGETSPVRISVLSESRSAPQEPSDAKPTGMIELTRFAFQSLYAPERLIDTPLDVDFIRLKSRQPISNLVPGAAVMATPIRQWRSATGLYATALDLQNTEPRTVELDPRRTRYNRHWITWSTLTGVLTASATPGDSTIAVVLSDSSWSEASTWLH